MSVIIRLQNLPISAKSGDIRHFFRGLRIPDGGVHIIGGDKGIVFVAFKSDEDARIAMRKDGWKINNNKVRLYLSSHMEMIHEIEQLMKRGSTNEFESQTSFNKYSSPNRTITKDNDKAANYNMKDYLSYSSDEDNKTHTYEIVHSTKRDRSSLSPRSRLMEESLSLKQRSHSSNYRSRSPNIQEETFLRQDSRAQVMQRSRSPYIRRSRSPYDGRSRSPYTRRIQSPNIRSQSPYAERSRSPFVGRSQLSYVRRSPSVKRSLSPHVKMSKLQYMRSPSPYLRRSRSPLTKRSISPCVRSRSPFKRRSQSPRFKRSWSSKGRDSPIYLTSFEKSEAIGSAYIESDRRSTKNDQLYDKNYISDPLFRRDIIETDSYTKLSSSNEEQRQLEEKISKALNTKFVENAFGMTSKPDEDLDISRTITQHVPDYYKNEQIPFISDFNSEASKVMDVNEQYQPFNSISDNISLNIGSNNDQQNFYDIPMFPPFQDQGINMLHTAPSSSIPSASMFPQSHELHPADMTPTMPISTTQSFPIPFTGYYVTLIGLDPFWTDGELQIMLKGIFAPQGNIRWEMNDNGFKTGVAFVKILNIDDFNQILMYPTFVYNNRVITVNECPNYIYEKYFPPPIVPPLPEQMIVKDGDFYYKMKALPYSVTIEEIMQFFYGFHIADLYIEETGGKRTGIGYIGFATIADYDRARIMHNKKMQHMYVQLIPCSKQDMLNAKTKFLGYFNPTSQPGGTYKSTSAVPKRRLCATITGLPSFVKITKLQIFFKEKGLTPHAIHVIVNNQRNSLGRGFVEFSNIRDFDAALKFHGELIGNKMICVKQILYDEMIKILGANKTKHYYAEDDRSNLFPIEVEPEKAPYIWDPPDQDSSPQKSLNEFHQYDTFNALPSNNISICNTNMQFKTLENQQSNLYTNSQFENNSGVNNYNKRKKYKWQSEIRNPVRFEVKIKPLSTKADETFDKINKEDIPQKLTKLTPEKEKLNIKHDSVLIKNEKKMEISGKEKDQMYKFPVATKKTEQASKITKPILKNVDGAKKIQDTVKTSKSTLQKDNGVIKVEGTSKVISKPPSQKDDGIKKIEEASKVISKPTLQKDGVKKMEGASKVISKPTLQKDGGIKKMESSSKIINKPKLQKEDGSKQKSNRFGNSKIIKGNNSHINRESRGKYSPPRRRRSPSPRRGNRRQYSPDFRRDSFEYRRNISPDQSREVIIQMSNVHPLVGEAELREFFHGFDIQEKMSRRYSGNGEPLGDIRVTISSRQEAERALRYLDGLTLKGRSIDMIIVD